MPDQRIRRQIIRPVPRRGWRAVHFWISRVVRNLSDQPGRSFLIALTVAIGVCAAISIIAASNGIEYKINALLNTSVPGQSAALKAAGVNLDDIHAVLRTTRSLLSKLAIGFTAASVGMVTLMTLRQRRRNIGIARQEGQHQEEVVAVLLGESLVLCLVGGGFGVISGIVLCAFENHMSSLLPMRLGVPDVLAIFPATTLLAFLITVVIALILTKYVNVSPDLG